MAPSLHSLPVAKRRPEVSPRPKQGVAAERVQKRGAALWSGPGRMWSENGHFFGEMLERKRESLLTGFLLMVIEGKFQSIAVGSYFRRRVFEKTR